MDEGMARGDSAHLADPIAVPAAEPPNWGLCEAPRLAAVKQDREHIARVKLPLEPLRDVGGAEDADAQGAEGLRRLLGAGVEVAVVRGVAMGERAEINKAAVKLMMPPQSGRRSEVSPLQ